MKSKLLHAVCGALTVLFGIVALFGAGLLPSTVPLETAEPDRLTGLGLCLSGMALLLRFADTRRAGVRRVETAAGFLLLALGGLALWGLISRFFFALPLSATPPASGTGSLIEDFSPYGALAVCLIGFIYVYKPRREGRRFALTVQTLTVALLTIGIIGLAGMALNLEMLFDWFAVLRVDWLTAIGITLVALGIWSSWYKPLWQENRHLAPDEKIGIVGAIVLSGIALATGLTGFSILQTPLQNSLADGLRQNLDSRIFSFNALVSDMRSSIERISRRPSLGRTIEALQVDPENAVIRNELQQQLESIVGVEFHAASILDNSGRVLARSGQFIVPELRAELDRQGTLLIEHNTIYYLNLTRPIYGADKRPIGQLRVELPDHSLTQLFLEPVGFGATGELVLCRSIRSLIECWPQNRQPRPYFLPTAGDDTQPLPIMLAVDGASGIKSSIDYRGTKVLAAYAPAGLGGFGLVLKQDRAEIYRPITDRVVRIVPALLFMIAGGVWLLRAQAKPLMLKLVDSERSARQAEAAALESEARIHAVVETIGDGVITIDTEGKVWAFNPAACEIFGYAPDEIIGHNLRLLMPQEMRGLHENGMRRYLDNGESRIVGHKGIELPALHKNGTVFTIELSVNELQLPDRRLFVGIVRDITARKEAEQQLYTERERLHVTLESIGDAVITTDTQGRTTYLNPVAEAMSGWRNPEAIGKPLDEVFNVIRGPSRERMENPVKAILTGTQARSGTTDTVLVRRGDGAEFAIDDSAAPIRNQNGEIMGMVLVFRDVTEARRLNEQITHQATHDVLTGLINRREFERRLAKALERGSLERKGHALLYLDLDQFKIVNDTCGHVAGDELLIQVTTIFKQQLRDSDTFARLGGDEFAVVLENCPQEAALRVAESLRKAISEFHFVWQSNSFTVGVSIGLVAFDKEMMTLSDVLSAADSACYVAKEKGRNRIHVYRPDDEELAKRHGEMGWVARIQRALQDDRFVLYAQRIECLGEAPPEHVHYELLLRMRGDDDALIPPMAFIPAAERYDQMPAIDRWVIQNGMHFLRRARADGRRDLCLSINLSGASLNDETLLPFIREQFRITQVPHAAICFEVTETTAIANLSQASRLINDLKQEGCRFSLDDFGSGMSSFAYLKHLPVDYLKIDGSFVKDIATDPIDYAMVKAINNIGQVMGIETIAEFMENDDIRSRLIEIGVNYAQGYGIAKPVPLDSI